MASKDCVADSTSYELSAAWFGSSSLSPKTHLRLYCFPFAGGGASVYRQWSRQLPVAAAVCPVQLPGREERWTEEPITDLTHLIDTLTEVLWPWLDVPFAFFGHSMGALMAFELAREIRRRNGPKPIHLFVSGARAPHAVDHDPPIHHLPDAEFVAELAARHNGIPHDVMENDELMELVLPLLRADFSMCEQYRHVDDEPLDCPISVYAGDGDAKVNYESLAGWSDHTRGGASIRVFPGDHFFVTRESSRVLEALSNELLQILDRLGDGSPSDRQPIAEGPAA